MTNSNTQKCKYVFSDGTPCPYETKEGQDNCVWHTYDDRTEQDIKKELEQLARDEKNLEGFKLPYAKLHNVYLINANLSKSDFTKADLSDGHLYGINLNSANLFKTNLENANLRAADLRDCDLLGANLTGTKLENTRWNKKYIIINEKDGDKLAKQGDLTQAVKKYREAEEIYRNIKLCYRESGHNKQEGPFFHREMVAARKQLPLFSLKRFISKLLDYTTGYGEKPLNVVATMLITIVFFAFLYGLFGVKYNDQILKFNSNHMPIFTTLLNLLYFSTIVFTTVGFGDITPVGISKTITMVESLCGQIIVAFLITTLYRKNMSR